jgi:16S rRNA (uracil1498-N3)-methyltransferase
MPAERYYFSDLLESGQNIAIKDQEFHHLVHVMRTQKNDVVEVVNGIGQLAQAIVLAIEKKQAVLSVSSVYTEQHPSKQIILAQGIPRQNRLELIIEKSIELGVTEIWLFPAAKSEKKDFSENQLERLNTLAVAAMKQCGRLFLPKFLQMPTLKKWTQHECLPIFFGDTNPDALPFLDLWKTLQPFQGAIFCIGPESGFTTEELAVLQKLKAVGTKLHPNILRTETAAITAVALMSHFIHYI